MDVNQFQTVLNLNLTGTVIPTQVFLKPMVEAGKGSIINFSSMAAFRPMTRVCGYAAAKAGISNFTAYMAHETAKKFGEGIRVNAIAPGFFITARGALWYHPLLDERCRIFRHRYSGSGRWWFQHLRYVI